MNLKLLSTYFREPIIASTIACRGQIFPHDFVHTGSNEKSSQYCFELAKKLIIKAETTYQCKVVGFISDNENKMLLVRKLLQEWRPDFIVYGCSAHYLNLVQKSATPPTVMSKIISVQKHFLNHHKPLAWLREKGGLTPQLPNATRWMSQRAALRSFIKNYPKMIKVMDEHGKDNKKEFSAEVKTFLESRLLFINAKHMLELLNKVSKALNAFQSGQLDLSLCTAWWLRLLDDDFLSSNDDIKQDLANRAEAALSDFHLFSYFCDHRQRLAKEGDLIDALHDDEWTEWPILKPEMEARARKFLNEAENGKFTPIIAMYDLKDCSFFPAETFIPTQTILSPQNFWEFIRKLSPLQPVKDFCALMEQLFACPSSSGGIERVFSSGTLVHNKLRNRLSNERVFKLIKVCRSSRLWREKNFDAEEDHVEDEEQEVIARIIQEAASKDQVQES